MRETEKFRTERLVARPWQIEDLPLAMELWGDPAVTALIDSRGKLTNAQVGEKLRAEIERERSGGVQYRVLFDHRNGEFVGCGGLRPGLYTPGEANFEVGFHLVKRCWGKGFATEAAFGALQFIGLVAAAVSRVHRIAAHPPSAGSCLAAARFVPDSPLEGDGFEPSVPRRGTRLF
jgi:ribosomal-protein-alanine N-acetyltransferase